MITAVAFVLAAATGTLVRAEAGRRWNCPGGFPTGTVTVNVSGSFLLGLLGGATGPVVTVLGVGGLGAYTTFSSFAHDVASLGVRRRRALAASYVVLTSGLGVAAAAAGLAIAS